MPLRTDIGCLYCTRPDIVRTRRFLSWPPSKHVLSRCDMSVVLDNYRRNAPAACPSPPDAAIQPLDSSARNPLICMALTYGPCGLRATFRERGRSEEWLGESGMWPGTGWEADRRSPQASAETLKNTREPARSRNKKTPTENGWGFIIGGGRTPVQFRLCHLNSNAAGVSGNGRIKAPLPAPCARGCPATSATVRWGACRPPPTYGQ